MKLNKDWEDKDKPRLTLTVQSTAPVGLPFSEVEAHNIRITDHYDNVASVGAHARLLAGVAGWYTCAVDRMARRIRKEEGKEQAEAFVEDMEKMVKDMVETGIVTENPSDSD